MERWMYVQDYGCYKFKAKVCKGNDNRFVTEKECMEKCDAVKTDGNKGIVNICKSCSIFPC